MAGNTVPIILERLDTSSEGCWEWQGGVNSNGYGVVSLEGKMWYTHRLVWSVFIGPIPEGMFVRHRCDNKLCSKPSHLELGTPRDNRLDYTNRQLPKERARRAEEILELRRASTQGSK